MNMYDATEQAYKNGYSDGLRDAQNAKDLCENCVCLPVCGVYRATGGTTQCKFHQVENTGRWILKWHIDPDGDYKLYHCSECDTPNARERNYCNECGARMRGVDKCGI